MNAAWTYDTLVAALQTWPVKSSAAYVADIPRIIGLGEVRVVRDLNLEIFEITDDVDIDASTREVDKPADLLVLRSFHLNVGASSAVPYKYLKKRSYDFCIAMYPSLAGADEGEPEMYAELSETQWYVVPTPNGVYTGTVRYTARPVGLTSSNQTSWLGTYVPDSLFAACLMEAEHYLKADDRYNDWKTKYQEELLPMTRLELRQMIRTGDYTPYKPAAKSAEG